MSATEATGLTGCHAHGLDGFSLQVIRNLVEVENGKDIIVCRKCNGLCIHKCYILIVYYLIIISMFVPVEELGGTVNQPRELSGTDC